MILFPICCRDDSHRLEAVAASKAKFNVTTNCEEEDEHVSDGN
jgi:hypothetical protein